MSGLLPRRARAVLGRRAGLVWAVPLAALLIVAYLAIRAIADPRIEATIVFKDAAGAAPGDTKVVYRGLQVGHVSRISLDHDGHSVDVTVRLDPRVRPALTSSAAFWLEGASVDLSDLASLRAAVAGVTIDMAAGVGGAPARHFVGLDARPVVMPDERGTWYWLQTDNIGTIRAGSNVLYRGIEVGKIARVDLGEGPLLRAHAFVRAPYDARVRPGSLFWTVAPLRISFSGADIGAQFDPSAALGAVTFETPDALRGQPRSAAGTVYTLFPDQTHAQGEGVGPKVLYRASFSAPVGALAKGAPVTLGGVQVGAVTDVGMSLDPATGRLDMPVTFAIEPLRTHLKGVASPRGGDWGPVMNRAMAGLVRRGYRAELEQNPPLVGASFIALDPTNLGPARLGRSGPYAEVPSYASPDLTDLGDKTAVLLDHLDALPLQEIGDNTRQITGRLARLLNSGKIDESVSRLDDTLNQTDQLLRSVRPQAGPLIADLRHAADQMDQLASSANQMVTGQGANPDANLPDALRELTNAARSVRSLADEIQRHPEALIQGKSQ